uniref:Transcription factor HES-5 n=1 Tax=Dicentrarchus labrax TaxID=13489 RepID=A0A8C4HMR1_DICLA
AAVNHEIIDAVVVRASKPLVEKMRRDRINSCIEQLKVLLEKEFHKQDPNAKLVKDDVLEMTVVFLRRQLPLSGGLNAARPEEKLHQHCGCILCLCCF